MAEPTTLKSLTLQRERLRVRAVRLRQQQEVLKNELDSPGIGEDQAIFLRKRMATLSTEEEGIGAQIVQTERALTEFRQKEADTRLQQQTISRTQTTTSDIRRRINPQAAAIGQRLQTAARQRIREIQKSYGQQRKHDLAQLEKVQKPVWWAFLSVLIAGLSIDILNIILWYFGVGVGAIADIVIGIFVGAFMFLIIRAFINRDPIMSFALACCLLVGGFCILVLNMLVIPIFIGIVLFIPVAIAGIWNPGAKVVTVSKKNAQERIQGFEKRIQKAQKVAVKINNVFGIIAKDSAILVKALPFAEGASAVLGWMPWQTFTIAATYWSLKKNYRQSQILLAQYKQREAEAINSEVSTVQATLVSQLGELSGNIRRPLPKTPAPQRTPPNIASINRPAAAAPQMPRPVIQKSIPATLPAAA